MTRLSLSFRGVLATSVALFLLVVAVATGCLSSTLSAAPAVPFNDAAAVVGLYDPAVEYPVGSLAIGHDGNTYRASMKVKGTDPTQSKADSWRLAHVAKEVILDVPTRFPSISAAMNFLDGCRIAESVSVVVLVASGKLEHDAPLVLNHAEGGRIIVRGAGEKPGDSVLLFRDDDGDQQDGIVIDGGHGITLENLTVASAARTGKGIGILVDRGSSLTASDCRVIDFSVVGAGNSTLKLTRCEFRLGRPGDAVHVRNGAESLLVDCAATGGPSNASEVGFSAYNGGTLFCQGCRAEGWTVGFKAYTNSVLHLERCVARKCAQGASAWFASSMNVIDCTFVKNDQVGVAAIYSSAVGVVDSRLTDNGAGAWTIGNAVLQFLDKPSAISGSRLGIEAKAGGRADLSAKPVFSGVDTPFSVGGGLSDLTVEQAFSNLR